MAFSYCRLYYLCKSSLERKGMCEMCSYTFWLGGCRILNDAMNEGKTKRKFFKCKSSAPYNLIVVCMIMQSRHC